MIEKTVPRPPTTGRVHPRNRFNSEPPFTPGTPPSLDRCAFDAADPRLGDAAEILLPLRVAGMMDEEYFQPAEAGLDVAIAAGGCHLLVAGPASGKTTLLRSYAWRTRHPAGEQLPIRYFDLSRFGQKSFVKPPDDPIVLGTTTVRGMLVDGYAQMEHSARPAALASLLEMLRTSNDPPAMVIACRPSDMDALRGLLPVQSVIELLPPDDGEVVRIIAGHLDQAELPPQEMIDLGLIEVARQPQVLRLLLELPAATVPPAQLILKLMRVILERASPRTSQSHSLECSLIELLASRTPPYTRQELSNLLSDPDVERHATIDRLIDNGLFHLVDESGHLEFSCSVWRDVICALGLVAPEPLSPATKTFCSHPTVPQDGPELTVTIGIA